MSVFEQSRYYFNEVLPEIIFSNIAQIDNFLASFWFIFFFIGLVLFIITLNVFRKKLYLQSKSEGYNKFLQELSLKTQKRDVEDKLVEYTQLVKVKYVAIYELRGETYILIESNTTEKTDVNAPLRIGRKTLQTFNKSGNYRVTSIVNSSQNNMLLFFSYQLLDIDSDYGFFDIALSYYEQISNKFKIEGGEIQSNLGKSTSVSLMKLQMDQNEFFKFFIALVIKITKAQGAKLYTKEGKLVFNYEAGTSNSSLQKVFYIRNTPYKLEFYDNKPLTLQSVRQVGSFLDMAGGFLINRNQNSEMVQNYLSFLKFTNEAIELENKYYKNHSLIVQIISVELAKSLFLSEDEIDTISLGAYLHDIGMIGDLLTVINKEKFEEQDMNLIKEHPLIGGIVVEPICHLYPIENIVKYHHERFDGRGYPFGLKESQIPIDAQIVAVGEFYAGITSDRSYKKGKTHEEAVEEIKNLREKMFGAVMVDAFLDVEKSIRTKILKIKSSLKEESDV